MKSKIYRLLIALMVLLHTVSYAKAQSAPNTESYIPPDNPLLEKMQNMIGAQWNVEWNGVNFIFTSKNKVVASLSNLMPCMPPPAHNRPVNIVFYLRQVDYYQPNNFTQQVQKVKNEYIEVEKEVNNTVKSTPRKPFGKPSWPYRDFHPENEDQKELVNKWKSLRLKTKRIPAYYYENQGFQYWTKYGYKVTQKSEIEKHKQLTEAKMKFLKQLHKYPTLPNRRIITNRSTISTGALR